MSFCDLFADYISLIQSEEDWDVEGLHNALKADYAATFPLQEWLDEGVDVGKLKSRISQGPDNNSLAHRTTWLRSDLLVANKCVALKKR